MSATANDEEDDYGDSEAGVYQPDLHLDDVNMLLDPATAPAAYRKAISGLFVFSIPFYRAMHFSAKRGIAIACRLSVRPSVCLSVCNVGEL